MFPILITSVSHAVRPYAIDGTTLVLYYIDVTDRLQVNYPLIRVRQQSTEGLQFKIYDCTQHFVNCYVPSPAYAFVAMPK